MITLTNPVPRQTITTMRLRSFSIDTKTQNALCLMERGYNDGQRFVVVDHVRIEFRVDSTPTYDELVAGVQGMMTLKRRIEDYLATLPDGAGTVS